MREPNGKTFRPREGRNEIALQSETVYSFSNQISLIALPRLVSKRQEGLRTLLSPIAR